MALSRLTSVIALIVALATLACVGSPAIASVSCAAMTMETTDATRDAGESGQDDRPTSLCTAQCQIVAAELNVVASPGKASQPSAPPHIAVTLAGVRPTPSTPPPRIASVQRAYILQSSTELT